MAQPLPPRKAPVASIYDGAVRSSLTVEHSPGGEGFTFSRLEHQDCAAILDHNREVMAAGGSRTASFGKVELCIPELELRKLKRRYPDLASPDKEIRLKAWKRFIQTAEAKPWKVSQPRYSTARQSA
jgi:hypothetical protein